MYEHIIFIPINCKIGEYIGFPSVFLANKSRTQRQRFDEHRIEYSLLLNLDYVSKLRTIINTNRAHREPTLHLLSINAQ